MAQFAATFFKCGACGYIGDDNELIPDDGPNPHPCGKDECPECGVKGCISCCLHSEDFDESEQWYVPA